MVAWQAAAVADVAAAAESRAADGTARPALVAESSISSPAAAAGSSGEEQSGPSPSSEEDLPPEVLFEERSRVPRQVLDLSAWAWKLREPSVLERVAGENGSFGGLVLQGPSSHVDDGLVAQLCRVWSGRGVPLSEVDLSRCQALGDASVKALTTAFYPTLTALRLSGCPLLTDRSLEAIARRCPLLRVLEVDGCHELSAFGLVPLAKHCPKLAVLNIARCTQISDRALIAIRWVLRPAGRQIAGRQSRSPC